MKNSERRWNGEQVTEAGTYTNMPLSVYHSPHICAGDVPVPSSMRGSGLTTYGPSISSSGLRDIFGEGKSAKHFFAKWSGNPNYVTDPLAEEKKRHFVIGRALHFLLLGEKNFAKFFIAQPPEWPDEHGELKPWHNARHVCKAWNRKRVEEGRSWLTGKEIEQIKQMAVSASNHPLVQAGALNGRIERSIFWRDKETGVWLKSRPDAIPGDSGIFVDLKTCQSTDWSDLQRSMREFSYYRQASMVRAACRHVIGTEWDSFTLIFVEKQNPWHTRDVRTDDEDLHRGDRANRAALRIFAKCIKTGEWPGHGHGNEGNERLPLSPQAREAMDTKLKFEGLADNAD